MRVLVVGGGPGGLFFGRTLRRLAPDWSVEIHERNAPEDTFGFGVVFSDETLDNLQGADPEMLRAVLAGGRTWRCIRIWKRGSWITSKGHGFSAISRSVLLSELSRAAEQVGCVLRTRSEIREPERMLGEYDLIVGADGLNSMVRSRWSEHFRPRIQEGSTRFSWLATTLELADFTFLFIETAHGLLRVHAYPYGPKRSTWIVECSEETWTRLGLAGAGDEETIALLEPILSPWLEGERLLANRSIWRKFPTLTCERWRAGRVVLLGDAAHTAHFSIGSGTRLAMEDALALARALVASGVDVDGALERYEEQRHLEVLKLQRAARTSERWFEVTERWLEQSPTRFAFNLLSRSKRITYDELETRDPELVRLVRRDFAAAEQCPTERDLPPSFQPVRIRELELHNRIVVSPMCQYSAVEGTPGDWHLVHLGSRALGGAGLVIAEMTDVSAEGRITLGCTGLYREEHVRAWKRIVDFVHASTRARIGIQIAHAGRKGSCAHDWSMDDRPLRPEEGAWETLAPSPIPFAAGWPPPREMTRADMELVREQFVAAARRALEAGFDWLEIHLAHGYLLSSFLSPLSNRRGDDFGGSLENRMRYPLEVVAAVRDVWPSNRPLSARISATDWLPEGFTDAEAVVLSRELARRGVDVIDVSSAGNVPDSPVEYGRMYQAPFADRIRHEAGVRVMAVGGVFDLDHANTLLAAGRADLVALARAHLADPYLTLHETVRYGLETSWPDPYRLAQPLAERRFGKTR